MTDEQILRLIDESFYDCSRPHIGLSGGEAFVFFDRLCKIVDYATAKGARVSVNSNGFWGITYKRACDMLKQIKSAGLRRLVISIDEFHEPYVPISRPLNVIAACKDVHVEVLVQYVSTKSTKRLADLLRDYGNELLNVECREIPCHPVGRATSTVDETDLFLRSGIPDGLCPNSVLSVSASGRAIPCCNAAGHLPALDIGSIVDGLPSLDKKFRTDPVVRTLLTEGPTAFVEVAEQNGYCVRPDGYIDQCHLCYDLFRDEKVASAIKHRAQSLQREKFIKDFTDQFERLFAMTPQAVADDSASCS